MADYNLKDDLLGFGRSQLKYMLFHNSTLADLDEYSYRKGLFFYDTDLDSLEFIKDNLTGWHSAISMISSNNPSFISDDDIADRFLIGAKQYSVARGFNPGIAGFLVIDEDGYPTSQSKILFEDIEPTDYTTVITAPGLDTRFATEKAIVDYVATQAVTPQNNILNWNGTRYLPYTNKLGSNPGYAYFYSSAVYPTFDNILNLDGTFRAYSLSARIASTSYAQLLSSGSLILYDFSNTFTISTNANETAITSIKSGVHTPIYFGQTVLNDGTGFTLDIANNLLKLNTTTIRINSGTVNKYLYLDESKNITYVDAPSGGVTPVDNIFDWDTNAYKPYTSKIASAFYTGITVPDAIATVLNYDGVFRATQLYEGAARVMTTHGNWTANGTLHAVTTTAHAGFCPQLPLFNPFIDKQFLRADGTWANIDSVSAWIRNTSELAVVPTTITDAVMIRSTSNLGTLTLGETSTLESIVFGIRDLADNQGYTTSIKWFTNGVENNEVLRLGIKGTGTSASAELYTELVNLILETPILNLNSDYDYSTAFYTEIRRDYSGAITSRVFNSASTAVTNAYASKIIGVHPSSADYATVNLTVTSKNFAGVSGEWEDNGTGYLKHSANLVTGGTIKPALNIGTREGQPIRFFVGGNSDLDFDNTTLRQVLWPSGNVSLGSHSNTPGVEAKYLLDLFDGDIRLTGGSLYFGGTENKADATMRLYDDSGVIRSSADIRATGYKSSDGSDGLTATGSFDTSTTRVINITIKNGLVTEFSITGGA